MSDGHGGNGRGSALRNLGRRDLVSLLDARREKEKSLRPAVFVRPQGPRYSVVKDIDGDVEYVVGSHGRQNFYPGQNVAVGSFGGHAALGEFILSDAPPAMGGASSYSTNSTSSDMPFSVPVEVTGDYLAFIDDGAGNVVSSIYARDAWVSDVGTVAVSTALTSIAAFIATDSGGNVSDGSLAWAALDGSGLAVADFLGSAFYTYATSGGYKLFGCGYVGGKLYWIEAKTDTPDSTPPHDGTGLIFHFRLRRSNCDLTSVTTLGTHDIDAAYPTVFPFIETPVLAGLVISGTACAMNVQVQVHEIGTLNFDVSFSLGGSGSNSLPVGDVSSAGSFGTVPAALGINATGTAVYALGGEMDSRPDGTNTTLVPLWAFGDGPMAAPSAGDLSAFDGSFMRRGPLGSAASPTDSFAPGEHPDLALTPNLMFALS